MRKFILPILLLTLFSFSKAIAQINYSFSASSGSYTALTGATPVTLTSAGVQGAAATDEGFANNIPIGFTFFYNGINYTAVHVNTNGFLVLGAPFTPGDGYYANSLFAGPLNQTSARPVIAPLWDDLELDPAVEGAISYQTTGAAGSRVFTVQYTGVRWDYNASGPVMSFQVKIFEGTNVVQFVYQQGAAAVTTDSRGASIGITAAGTGSGNFISVNNISTTPTASSTVSTDTITTKPATGQIFTFTPFSCISPANLQATNVTNTAATFTWNTIPGATGYEYAVSSSATAPASGTATTSTSANIALTTGSVNYLYVRTNCGGTFSVWSRRALVPCTTNISPANNSTNQNVPTSISWTAVPGATGYAIMFSTNNGPFQYLGAVPFTTTSVQIRTTYDSTYSFYIRPIAGSDTASTTCQTNATTFRTLATPPRPANDSCGAAVSLSPFSGIVNGYTVGATGSPTGTVCPPATGDPASNPDDDVWYQFTAVQNGTATITVIGDAFFDAVVTGYSGACATLTQMACIDSSFEGQREVLTLTNLVAGQTYYIRVYDWDVNNPGTFTISVMGAALPVGITKFSGEHQSSKNVLTWSTATEQNNKGFEVQRSIDGVNYSTIAFVNSKAPNGNSNSTLNYIFEDSKPLANNHYRLKQVDKDEKVNYTNVVVLKGLKFAALQISRMYPNPVAATLNMLVSAPSSDQVTFIVSDLAGKIVLQKAAAIVAGDNNIRLNVERLRAGSYMIKAVGVNGNETSVNKFMKH